jgi:hypothetical protein
LAVRAAPFTFWLLPCRLLLGPAILRPSKLGAWAVSSGSLAASVRRIDCSTQRNPALMPHPAVCRRWCSQVPAPCSSGWGPCFTRPASFL